MSVFDLIGAANKLAEMIQQPAITVDTTRCTHLKHNASSCQACIVGCPVEAIRLENNRITVDNARCLRCGYCLRACPTGVFTGYDGVDKLLEVVESLPAKQVLEISCLHHPDNNTRLAEAQSKIISTRCLVASGISAYAGLAASGVQQVLLRLDACENCPLVPVQQQIDQTVSDANVFLSSLEIIPVRQVSKKDLRPYRPSHTGQKTVSRRDLFQLFRKQEIEAPVEAGVPSIPLPAERVRLLKALHKPKITDQRFTPFVGLKVDSCCSACGLCATHCPTTALDMTHENGRFALTFIPGLCTNCGLCTELCPEQALTVDGPFPVESALTFDPLQIAAGTIRKCHRCGTSFSATQPADLCPVCEFRRRSPFGSYIKGS